MTVKELIDKLAEFEPDLIIQYVNEESFGNDDIAEVVKKKDYIGNEIVVLAREGCFDNCFGSEGCFG